MSCVCTAPLSIVLALTLSASAAAQWVEPSSRTLLEVESKMSGDSFGWIADSVGDVTGDGIADIVTSAPLDPTTKGAAGMVAVYNGATGKLVWKVHETKTSAVLGFAVQVFDWNGDGTLDVIAGAPFAQNGGRVFIYSGDDGTELKKFPSPGGDPTEGFGVSLAVDGDFDGDGVNDVAIGAMGYDHSGFTSAGRAYVYSGADESLITTIDGPYTDAEFGLGLAFLSDVSTPSDGRDELVVGHRDATFWGGLALVYSYDGTAVSSLYSVGGVGMGYNLFGDRIDAGGDLDGDGFADFMVGDAYLSVAKVFSGADGSLIHALAGNGEGGNFGTGHFVPDVDGDGTEDLLVGAHDNGTGAFEAGKVFLYSGREGTILRTMTHTHAGRLVGVEARAIGDHDGDGWIDFAFGSLGGASLTNTRGRFALVGGSELAASYCTAGLSASGCSASMSASGSASASAATGFDLAATGIEGDKDGVFFFGANGRQANPWGNGTSLQCVVPPVKRTARVDGTGTPGACDGWFLLDLHARWTARPKQNPGAGALVQAQLWYRDPFNTSNQTTSLSDAIEFPVGP